MTEAGLVLFLGDDGGGLVGGGCRVSQAGDDAADEFFQAGIGRFQLGFGLAAGLFPGDGKTWCLLAQGSDCGFVDLQQALFGAARPLLEGGEVDAEVFVLAAQRLKFGVQHLVAGGIDFELGVEVALEVAQLALHTAHLRAGMPPGLSLIHI